MSLMPTNYKGAQGLSREGKPRYWERLKQPFLHFMLASGHNHRKVVGRSLSEGRADCYLCGSELSHRWV